MQNDLKIDQILEIIRRLAMRMYASDIRNTWCRRYDTQDNVTQKFRVLAANTC
jgi:hypothetical protein